MFLTAPLLKRNFNPSPFYVVSGPRVHPFHHYHHRQWAQPLTVTPSLAPPSPIPEEIPGHSFHRRDVKERELLNLLRWLPGFEASQINSKGEQPVGFALFSTHQHAVAAKNALQDMVFDTDTKCTIHTEMAKKNLFVKRGVGDDFSSFDQSKRLRTGGDFAHSGFQSPPFHPQPVAVWATPGYMASLAPYDPFGGYPVPQVTIPSLAPAAALSVYALFSYKLMKILRQERNTVCFIEFDDVASATTVHVNLQGVVLPSSGRGGIRLQFSKNPFGRRKDSANGAATETNGTPTRY